MATLTTLASFNGANGTNPGSGLIIDASGNLLGTTWTGGTHNDGTVFELANTGSGYANTPTVLANFDGTTLGSEPEYGSLVADAAGNLFGTAPVGAANSYGAVIEIPKSGTGYGAPIALATFNSSNGSTPFGTLILDAAGDLVGTAAAGGPNNAGTVFEITKTANGYSSTPTLLASFNSTDGTRPNPGLVTDANGDLFGTTSGGGSSSAGVVFEIAKTAGGYATAPTVLVNFGYPNAANPESGLVADAAGDLFGTTINGSGYGSIFEIAKTATGYATTPTILANLPATGADGETPYGTMIIDAAGNLFGTTQKGGTNNFGVIFELAKTGSGYGSTPTVVTNLNSSTGYYMFGGLVADSSGNLYGTTFNGGTSSDGTVFEVTNSGFVVPSPTQVALVDAYYQAILRTTPSTATANSLSSELSAGTLTTSGLLTQLLTTAQSTSIPALLSYDFVYGTAPASSGLTYLSTYAADLQSGNYTYTGGFQLGTTPGEFSLPQFSVLNTYVNLCATGAINPSPFNSTYSSLAASATTANRTTFFNEVYTSIFGFAPAASTTTLFVTSPAAANPAITTFQYYVNYAGSELGGYGAIAGVLLYTAETSNLGTLPTAATDFLTQAATSTAAGADTAPYGVSLLTSFPSASPTTPVTQADTASFIASAPTTSGDASPNIIVAAQGNSTLVGTGASDVFSFAEGTAGNTTIKGFDPAQDFIRLTNGFSAAGIASVLSSATATSAGTALVLSDGTHITLAGILPTSLTATSIFAS